MERLNAQCGDGSVEYRRVELRRVERSIAECCMSRLWCIDGTAECAVW